jgi:hypothetical protein
VGGEPGEVWWEDIEGAVPVDGDCGFVEVGEEEGICKDVWVMEEVVCVWTASMLLGLGAAMVLDWWSGV